MYGIRIENTDGTPRAAGTTLLVTGARMDLWIGTLAEATAKAAQIEADIADLFPLERNSPWHTRYIVTPLPFVGAMADVSRETAAADVSREIAEAFNGSWSTKCADVAAAFAPTLHTLFGNARDVHVGAEFVKQNEHAVIFHGIVTPLTPLTCDDVARFAGGMEMLCENESMPRDAMMEREIAGHSFWIGDGDDTAAAWMRGGVVYVWIRHFFE